MLKSQAVPWRVFLKFGLLCFLLSFCSSCEKKQDITAQATTVVVSRQKNSDTLYLSSTIAPIALNNVSAPFDGSVTQMHFAYGEMIKEKQILFILNSNQFADSYGDALSNYLKAMREYSNSQAKMRGTEALNRLGIISRDEYENTQSQLYNSSLALVQAEHKWQELTQKVETQPFDLNQLKRKPAQDIMHALQNINQSLTLYAPKTGIALLPEKHSDSDDNSKPLQPGDQVKAGQTLLTIGDMSGILLTVKVNENHINDIKKGQLATISSQAFAGTLNGHVVHVDQQANQESSDALPSFKVKIAVPSLTLAQRSVIHAGMSAKIALQIIKPDTILLPLSAILSKDGKSYVKRLDAHSGKVQEVPVETGTTTLDAVEITQGLAAGERVLVNATH